MNLIRYLITAIIVHTARCNTFAVSEASSSPQNSDENPGVITRRDNLDITSKDKSVLTYDLTKYPMNHTMTSSSNLLQLILSSKTSIVKSQVRIRRGAHGNKNRKKCPKGKKCPRKPRRNKKPKKPREPRRPRKPRCKRKGKNGRGKGKKRPRNRNCNKPPPVTKMVNATSVKSRDPRRPCIRTLDCDPGWCCARQNSGRICKPLAKLNDICTRPPKKHRRRAATEIYQRCPCEENLSCQVGDYKKNGNPLYTCQLKT